MIERRSLKWPITLGVIMILLIVALTVGWVLLAVFGALQDQSFAPLYWTLLSVGTLFLVLVLVGVVMYLALSVKAINLNQRQSNFIDSVTHELKSPIASLKLCLQTMARRPLSPEQHEDFVRYMLEDVERLDNLINHLLDAARLEKTPQSGLLEEVRLDEVLQTCAAEVCLRHQRPMEAIDCRVEPCLISARHADLAMIFRNLLDNAAKYAGEPPDVSVTSHLASDGWIVTRVTDNGRGVPRSMRDQIFQRFVRLGMELERDKPGTGLGLHIVHTLVKRLGGQIRVQDPDTGSGTVFEVRLPGGRHVDSGSNLAERNPRLVSRAAD
jgi:signal transduction histidine kinase